MLPTAGRGLRLALMLSLGVGFVAFQGHHHAAYAKGDDDGGDDDSADDDKGKGGDEETETDEEVDKDQPPVTSGGLFTLNSYPQREILRPLILTQGITQLKLSLGTDISAKGAFGTGGLSLEVIHGVTDNFSVIGGVTDAYNFKQFSFYAGFEAALVYDLVDIRLAANLHRSAIPEFQNFCSPVATGDPVNPNDATTCKAGSTATIVNLPDGNYTAGGGKFSIDLGFPFRYAINPAIAIVALQTLIAIDFNHADKDHTLPSSITTTDAMGNMVTTVTNIPAPNGVKPDLKPSLGIATNPIAPLSITIFAQLIIPDFDTSAGAFQIPVTARVEFSPTQKLDVGLEFTLLNIAPPDPQTAIDNRFLSLFATARF
jgi:hypothetical protein